MAARDLARLGFAAALGLGGAQGLACATAPPQDPSDCRSRAESEYRRCLNPQWHARGEPVEPLRGETTQQCQAAYRQALGACGEPTELPEIELGAGTSTSAL